MLKSVILEAQIVTLILKTGKVLPECPLLQLVGLALITEVLDLKFELSDLLLEQAMVLDKFPMFFTALVPDCQGFVFLGGDTALQSLDLLVKLTFSFLILFDPTAQKEVLCFHITFWR